MLDDDHDGLVSQSELERHQAEVVADLGSRWSLADGDEKASVARVDLIVQPPDQPPPGLPAIEDRADQLVMLHHARFSRPPARIALDTDLFGEGLDATLTVDASVDPRAEQATLHSGQGHHAFFAPSGPSLIAKSLLSPWLVRAAALGLGLLLFYCRHVLIRR